jgi:hypothetical protein
MRVDDAELAAIGVRGDGTPRDDALDPRGKF